MQEETQLAVIKQEATALDYSQERVKLHEFIKKIFRENKDYGIIPGTRKQSLFQPGAEKIAKLFGLTPTYQLLKEVEDFDKGFFYYKYKCSLTHFASGKFVGDAERSCNSKEKKYATVTVAERFATEDQKKRAIGKKKNEKYNSYDLIIPITPEEAADKANTIQAMAQKRAFVAAVRVATGASEIFDEDDPDISDKPKTATKQAQVPVDRAKETKMKELHVIATKRGFTHEQLSNSAKKRYSVTSMSECTLQQLTDLADDLQMTFEEVGPGDKPKKIGEPYKSEVEEEGEVITETNCRNCNKPGAPTEGDHAWYCDQKCKDEYNEKRGLKRTPTGFKFTKRPHAK